MVFSEERNNHSTSAPRRAKKRSAGNASRQTVIFREQIRRCYFPSLAPGVGAGGGAGVVAGAAGDEADRENLGGSGGFLELYDA